MNLLEMTAVELAAAIREGKTTAIEAVRASLERIEEKEERYHCYVTIDREGALAQAEKVQRRIESGELSGALAGVPMAVKDNLCTAGMLTTCSSRILRNFVPAYSAEAVWNLQKAGAVIIGKTNMDEFAMGSRVYEAVEAAGGFAADADQNYVNQAQTLKDGVKLVIPTMEEAAQAREREPLIEAAQGEDGVQDGRININTATAAQLCDIPGVGATRAAAIIAYRESHGGFHKPEDIMKVDGIKEGMYEKIKDSISVN